MGECCEPSGCSRETAPGPATVKQASWRPEGGQSCGAGGSAHVVRWACESSGVLRLRSRLARYGPSGSPERSHRWKSAGFSVSSSLIAAGLGGGVRGVRTTSRMGPPRRDSAAPSGLRRLRQHRARPRTYSPSLTTKQPRLGLGQRFFLISLDRPRHSRTARRHQGIARAPTSVWGRVSYVCLSAHFLHDDAQSPAARPPRGSVLARINGACVAGPPLTG